VDILEMLRGGKQLTNEFLAVSVDGTVCNLGENNMPAKSPEAIARRDAKKRDERREKLAKRKSEMLAVRDFTKESLLRSYKIAARKMLPRLPPMTKSELRAMLSEAFKNTAAL
jgi:hypothetical protein